MAIDIWWLGYATQTTASVCVRCTANDSLTLSVNSGQVLGTADTSVKDGVVRLNVSGLSAGNSYPFTLSDGTTNYTGTLKTMPASGPIRVAIWSCISANYDNLAFRGLITAQPHLMISIGDFPYANSVLNRWGENNVGCTSSVANSKSAAVYTAAHRQGRKIPSIMAAMRSIPLLSVGDDHEWPFDDFAPVLSLYQAGVTGAGGAVQGDLDAAITAAKSALLAYHQIGNPSNDDSPGDTDPLYFRFTLGNCEFFVINCVEYRSAPAATDDGSKTMLGANQKAWLKARLVASTATFKCIVTTKQFFKGGGNADTWAAAGGAYQTELKEIINHYGTNNVKGVFAMAGDQHFPSVGYAVADALGAGYPPILCPVPCPIGNSLNAGGQGSGYNANVIWKWGGNGGAVTTREPRVFGLIDVTSTQAQLSIIDGIDRNRVLWSGLVAAGSNALSYPAAKYA